MSTPVDAILNSCSIERVWFVWTELSNDDDDDRLRDAVSDAVGLNYCAHYDRVCFESGAGTQFYRSRAGSIDGEKNETVSLAARVLTFSIPQDPSLLAIAIEAIREHHSYEEPVIYVLDGYATRADYANDRDNPNRFWNRETPLEGVLK